MTALQVEVLTPQGMVFKDEAVKSLLLPAERGQMGVLPQHAPTLLYIDIGLVTATCERESKGIFVENAFVSVQGESVHIIAEFAFLNQKESASLLKERLESLHAELNQLSDTSHDNRVVLHNKLDLVKSFVEKLK